MACVTVTATVDAIGFPPHAAAPAALSLPTTHPNGSAHAGHPVPTYSTVLLALCPHVVTVSVPPSGVADPRSSAYSSREPPKNARKPDAHVPDVYMAGCPDVTVDRGGAVPLTPVSTRTSGSPRHTGGVGEGVVVRVAVEVPVRVRLGVMEGGELLLGANLQGSATPPAAMALGTAV